MNHQEQEIHTQFTFHLLDTRTQSMPVTLVDRRDKRVEVEEKTKQGTYISVHQLAVVLHLISAVLVRHVSLFGVLIDVGRQFLPLVEKRTSRWSLTL